MRARWGRTRTASRRSSSRSRRTRSRSFHPRDPGVASTREFVEQLDSGAYDHLKGRPVVPIEACSAIGDLGDINRNLSRIGLGTAVKQRWPADHCVFDFRWPIGGFRFGWHVIQDHRQPEPWSSVCDEHFVQERQRYERDFELHGFHSEDSAHRSGETNRYSRW